MEIQIRAPLDDLWRLTQTPEFHQLWDLRFSEITYLPRPDESQPQRFLYVTRIGFGRAVRGEGESMGQRDSPESRTSALRFWSDERMSLIRMGSGYWKYEQTGDGARFLTRYGYQTRFGRVGRWFDALIFRPLLGWATAWSFDRLRLWLERGIDPADSLQRSLVYATARVTLAAVWLYQGLVPKLLVADSGERDILRSSGLFPGWERRVLTMVGLLEIGFGILLVICWHRPRLFLVNVIALLVLASGALLSQPSLFNRPFNPATLTVAMIALSVVGLLSCHDLPTARNCLRETSGNAQ
ncbi:MAG: DoxX-like family protein [Nitrolancea sp.]